MDSESSHNNEKALVDIEDNSVEDAFTLAEQRRIIRHIDRRLLTLGGILICVNTTDRSNLAAASIAGLTKDLNLIGERYSVVTLVFFIPYIIFQAPATVICRKVGPRPFLAVITAAWGLVIIGIGLVKNWESLAVLRVALGLMEAGSFPSIAYLLSTWYTRYDLGKRYAFFNVIGSLAGAFGGILAYGLIHLDGAGGLAGWRWIFIFEGLLTVVVAIFAYWLLVDFPDSDRKVWSFLKPKEREWVVRRVKADRGDVELGEFNIRKLIRGGRDWKVWAYGVMGIGTAINVFSFQYFLPIILHTNLGFSVAASQILVAPPYGLAAVYMFGVGYLGDKHRVRGPIIAMNMVLCLIGLPILGWHHNNYVRYFGCFLICSGANSNLPSVLTLQANNIRGQWKRAFCSALFVAAGGIGGIITPLVFRSQDAETGYKPGFYACIAAALIVLILMLSLDISYYLSNRAASRGEKQLECDEDAPRDDFRYTL
ncbi:MFS general substrate transporter [Xylariaceae sp. FL1272]|nr:MFS general substrate transporter [Xylariaceae sp. FL1272]